MAGAISRLPEIAEAQARIAVLEAVVAWYGEQVYLYANDTTEKADEADVALDQDGGKKARAALKETLIPCPNNCWSSGEVWNGEGLTLCPTCKGATVVKETS